MFALPISMPCSGVSIKPEVVLIHFDLSFVSFWQYSNASA